MNQISEYIYNFGKDRGLETYKDKCGNIIIKKNSSKSSEETVILQAHMDMVCVSDDKIRDFENKGIEIYFDDNCIKAKDSSLGADNGIGVAYMLSLIDDTDLKLPNIEYVFTTDEETGLIGAKNIDYSLLNGKKLINLDSEDEGIITLSCAGGNRTSIIFDVDFVECINKNKSYIIEVSGLAGGHSGVDIDKGYANSNVIICDILSQIDPSKIEIAEIKGGSADNAIADKSFVKINTNDYMYIKDIVKQAKLKYTNLYIKTEKNINIKISEDKETHKKVLSDKDKINIINYSKTVFDGVIKMSENIEGLVETSLNLGIINTTSNTVVFTSCIRSSIEEDKNILTDKIIKNGKLNNARHEVKGDYPSWQLNKNSQLKDVANTSFFECYGKYPEFNIIHAGLECGIFYDNIKDIDAISIGPTITGVHSTRESVDIDSINRIFDFLVKILINISNSN